MRLSSIFLLSILLTCAASFAQISQSEQSTPPPQGEQAPQKSDIPKSADELQQQLNQLDKDKEVPPPEKPKGKEDELNGSTDFQDIVSEIEKHTNIPGVDPSQLPSIEDFKSGDLDRIVPALEKAIKIPGLAGLKDFPSIDALKSGDLSRMMPEIKKLSQIKGLEFLQKLPDIDALKSGDIGRIMPELQKIIKIPGLENMKDWPNVDALKSGDFSKIIPEISKLSQIKGLEGLKNLPDIDALKSGDMARMLPEIEKMTHLPGLDKLNNVAGLKQIMATIPQVIKGSKEFKFHWEVASTAGWNLGMDLGIQTDWDLQRLTTGISTGQYLKLGGKIVTSAAFLKNNHEWRNKFYLHETFGKSPNVAVFVKSHDHLILDTKYIWTPWVWLGCFGQATLDTPIFPGQDVQINDITYFVYDSLGNLVETDENVDYLKLSGFFAPLQLAQSIGGFVRPFKLREIIWEIKVGAYAFETFADGAKRVLEILPSGDVNVKELETSYQFGPSLSMDFYGILFNDYITYQVSTQAGYTVVDTSGAAQAGVIDSFNFKGLASVTFKPLSWIGLTLDTRITYLPNIVAGFQIANKVFVNFPFTM